MNVKWMILIASFLLLAGGCMNASSENDDRFATGEGATPATRPVEAAHDVVPPIAPMPEVESGADVIGRSVDGRPLIAYTLGEGAEDRTILFLASIHGNEAAGTPLVNRLISVLNDDPEKRSGWRVIVVPVANPDGLASGRRENRRNVDLNRNFPADNRQERARFGDGALSEPESEALYDLILSEQPERIVSLHQPLECVDYDGPGSQPIAERMAAVCDLPAEKLGARPGSLGAWAGETQGIPTITLELPREAGDASADADVLWSRYGAALLAALE